MHAVLEKISKIGLVPVIKLDDPDKAVDLATALKKGGIPVAEVTFRAEGADRAIAAIAKALPDVLVGAGTVITDGARVFVNPTGSSALSKGGSGDTLCGMICAFIAEGASPFDAAVIAAYIHGLAAERCAKVYSDYGVLASDVAAETAKVICALTAGEEPNA